MTNSDKWLTRLPHTFMQMSNLKTLDPKKKNNVHGSGLSIFFFSRLENSFNITPFEEKERNNEIYQLVLLFIMIVFNFWNSDENINNILGVTNSNVLEHNKTK